MIKDLSRYDPENLPISDKTRASLTDENINHLTAVSRMMSLQDIVYEEQFAELAKMQKVILDSINFLRVQITELRGEVKELRNEVKELSVVVDCTKKDVEILKTDVHILKQHDTLISHTVRGFLWFTLGVTTFILIHHFWFDILHNIIK